MCVCVCVCVCMCVCWQDYLSRTLCNMCLECELLKVIETLVLILEHEMLREINILIHMFNVWYSY